MQVEKRRLPRGRKAQVERDVAIMPTFVFARAAQLADLARVLALLLNPHPPFSIFRWSGRIPLFADRDIASLHAAEDRAARKVKQTQRYFFSAGERVRVVEGAGMGLSGVVEQGDGKFALVAFGGSMRLKIATWLLRTDEVQNPVPSMGVAA